MAEFRTTNNTQTTRQAVNDHRKIPSMCVPPELITMMTRVGLSCDDSEILTSTFPCRTNRGSYKISQLFLTNIIKTPAVREISFPRILHPQGGNRNVLWSSLPITACNLTSLQSFTTGCAPTMCQEYCALNHLEALLTHKSPHLHPHFQSF